MKSQRIKLVIITAVVFIAALSITALFVREIIQQSAVLRTQVETLEKDRAQQTQLNRIKKLVIETTEQRELLSSFFLASQSESIDFLNYIETLAADRGISLETISATEKEQDKQSRLVVNYTINGPLTELEQFISLLETVEYVSEIVELTLTEQTPASWEGSITLEVIIRDTYEATS